jgi:hypothetical protein
MSFFSYSPRTDIKGHYSYMNYPNKPQQLENNFYHNLKIKNRINNHKKRFASAQILKQ